MLLTCQKMIYFKLSTIFWAILGHPQYWAPSDKNELQNFSAIEFVGYVNEQKRLTMEKTKQLF